MGRPRASGPLVASRARRPFPQPEGEEPHSREVAVEFVAKLDDHITPTAATATRALVALKGGLLDVDKALRSIAGLGGDKGGAPAAIGDTDKAAGAAAPKIDRYGAALKRLGDL